MTKTKVVRRLLCPTLRWRRGARLAAGVGPHDDGEGIARDGIGSGGRRTPAGGQISAIWERLLASGGGERKSKSRLCVKAQGHPHARSGRRLFGEVAPGVCCAKRGAGDAERGGGVGYRPDMGSAWLARAMSGGEFQEAWCGCREKEWNGRWPMGRLARRRQRRRQKVKD